jgi:hypothetical protein
VNAGADAARTAAAAHVQLQRGIRFSVLLVVRILADDMRPIADESLSGGVRRN